MEHLIFRTKFIPLPSKWIEHCANKNLFIAINGQSESQKKKMEHFN